LVKALDSDRIQIHGFTPLKDTYYSISFTAQGRPEARTRASKLVCRKVNELGGQAHGRAIERHSMRELP
jgi:hypothetical protein